MDTTTYSTLSAFTSSSIPDEFKYQRRKAFYAILLECSDIDQAQAGGKDFYCKCKLIDESVMADHPDGVECMVFSSRSEALPIAAGDQIATSGGSRQWLNLGLARKQLTPGDVVRFHGVYRSKNRSKPQLVALLDKGAACCLFTRDPKHSSEPYWVSSLGSKHEEGHDSQLSKMRAFVSLLLEKYPSSRKLQGYRRSICDFENGLYLDLFCRILLVDRSQGDKPVICQLEKKRYGLHMEDLHRFPAEGSVVPIVVVSDCPRAENIEETGPNSWVKLRNISVYSVKGQWQGYLHKQSACVKCAIKSLDELSHGGNALSGISPLPSPGACQDVSCTQVDATTLPVTSLRAVLSRVFEKGPNLEEAMEFVCRVRVLGHSPQQVKDFARPVQIPGCGERLALYVRFHAEDPTGELALTVISPEADKLFGVCPGLCDASQGMPDDMEEHIQESCLLLTSTETKFLCCIRVAWTGVRPTFAVVNTRLLHS